MTKELKNDMTKTNKNDHKEKQWKDTNELKTSKMTQGQKVDCVFWSRSPACEQRAPCLIIHSYLNP